MFQQRRKLLSQNFLYDRKLLVRLVGLSSISKNDTVIDIGAGKGLLTAEIAQRAGQVLAVELDHKLILYLHKFLNNRENIQIIEEDFLAYQLPREPYKVFANIPFSIEGQIVRKLLDGKNPPTECCLVVRRELAERLSGVNGRNLFAVTHCPWFDFEITYNFRRSDFVPAPAVDCVLWKITRRESPLLAWSERLKFNQFVKAGYGHGDFVVHNLERLLGKEVAGELARRSAINRKVMPS